MVKLVAWAFALQTLVHQVMQVYRFLVRRVKVSQLLGLSCGESGCYVPAASEFSGGVRGQAGQDIFLVLSQEGIRQVQTSLKRGVLGLWSRGFNVGRSILEYKSCVIAG